MQLQPAFVLHTRPWRETSLLVELLTLDGGRIGMIARGVRSAKSKRKGLLQPFLPLLVSYKGYGELKNLSTLEAVSAPLTLRGSSLYCGLYINELLMRLISRELPLPGLFARYRQLLVELSCGDEPEPLLRQFELALLKDLGVLPSLAADGSGAPLVSARQYYLSSEQGFVLAQPNPKQRTYSGELLYALASGKPLPQGLWPEAKQLTRSLLRPLLGSRPLNSRALFQAGSGASANTNEKRGTP